MAQAGREDAPRHLRRDQPVAVLHNGDCVAGHVFGRRDDVALADFVLADRLAHGDGEAEHAGVALCHVAGRGGVGGGAGHAQRIEYVRPEIVGVTLAAVGLDDIGQHVVADVEILVFPAHRRGEAGLGQRSRRLLGGGVLGQDDTVARLGQATGMVQEMVDRDLARGGLVGDAEPGDVGLDRRVQVELALLGKLGHRQRGKRLALRADEHRRLRRHGAAACRAVALEIDDLAALDHGQRRAGQAMFGHLSGDGGVERGEVNLTWGGGRDRGGRCRREQQKDDEEKTANGRGTPSGPRPPLLSACVN